MSRRACAAIRQAAREKRRKGKKKEHLIGNELLTDNTRRDCLKAELPKIVSFPKRFPSDGNGVSSLSLPENSGWRWSALARLTMLAIFFFRGLRRRIDLSVPKVKYQLYVFWNFRMMERERNEMKTRAPFVRPSYSADTYMTNSRGTSSRSLRTAVISNIRKQLGAPEREYALSLAIYPFRSAPRASNSADVNFFLSPSPPVPVGPRRSRFNLQGLFQ